jgi:translation initiation factor 2B subunit (eIF-2B alpha/beta/delta family)
VTIHPAVKEVALKFEAFELHAARAGREVMEALATVVAESSAASIDCLAIELTLNAEALLAVMPVYAPPVNVMHRVFARLEQARRDALSVRDFREAVAREAEAYREWSEQVRPRIAECAGRVIPDGGVVFTFTLSETVLGAIRQVARSGAKFSVLVTESRPNVDGLTTALALADEGVHVEVGIDAGIGELVPLADVVLVGAEAVLSDGSAICKVGTYPVALAARRSSVPVYVLVDSMKIHSTSLLGKLPVLDPIAARDVLGEGTAVKAKVVGCLFDCTPGELIAAVVTERGLIHPRQVSHWMLDMPMSECLAARMADRYGG